MLQIIGQILGIIAFGIASATYQMKDRKKLLIFQTVLVFVMAVHYFCIGAYPGMAMNFFCVIRNVIYYRRDIFKWKFTPLVVSAIILIIGILTSTGIWSVLVIAGLTINTYCISFENPQHFRISLFITSPLVLVYNIVMFSLGGIMLESVSLVSSTIGLVRNRKSNNTEN